MKYRYKGRAKAVTLVLSEGDTIIVSHKRADRLMQGHPNFEEVKRGKRNGSDKGEHGDTSTAQSGETEL